MNELKVKNLTTKALENLENIEGRARVVIENVQPEIDCGRFPIKRVVGEKVVVQADIFADGHDSVDAALLYRKDSDTEWRSVPMRPLVNDRWEAEFVVTELDVYYYTVQGWVDHFRTGSKTCGRNGKRARISGLIC